MSTRYELVPGLSLRELREAAGISREDMAQRLGYAGEAGVRHLESGKTGRIFETVAQYLAACGYRLTVERIEGSDSIDPAFDAYGVSDSADLLVQR